MLEIACFTPSSAITAFNSGADRIELCADIASGGITPPISSLLAVREVVHNIPIYVMIRPRGGDFTYSAEEFERMKHDIAEFSSLASGFVFGILDAEGRVDVARNSALVRVAAPLPCTFHRAIDEAADLDEAVEKVIECGFTSVLTSGGAESAEEGVERLRALQEKYGARISVVVGGGVRSWNAAGLKRGTGVEWLHSSAVTAGFGEEGEVNGMEVEWIRGVVQAMQEQG